SLLVEDRSCLAIRHDERLIVALIRPAATGCVRDRLDYHIAVRGGVQHALQWIRQRTRSPLAAVLLVARARLVGGLVFAGNELGRQKECPHSCVRRPDYAVGTAFFARAGRTAAIRQFRRREVFAPGGVQIGLPNLPCRGNGKVDAFPREPPLLIRKPEQMTAVGGEVNLGSPLCDRLVRSGSSVLTLHA